MQSLKAKKPLKKKIGTLKKMRGGMRGAPANADQFELWTQQMERKRPLDQDEDPRSDFDFIPPTVEHRPAMPRIQNGIKSVMMKLGINTKEAIIEIIVKGIIKVKRMNGYSKSSLSPFEKGIDRFIKQSHYINDEINEDINVALELSKLLNYRMDAKDLLFDEIEATLDTEKLQEIMGQWWVADLVCQIKQVEKDSPYEYERKIVGVVTDFLKADRAEINRLMNTEYKAQKPPVIGMSIKEFIDKLILFEEKFEELVNAQVLYWLNGNKDKNDVDSKHQSLTSIFKVGGTGIAVLDKWTVASSVTISDELKLKLISYVFIDNDPIDCVQAIEDAIQNKSTPGFVKEIYEKFIDEVLDSLKVSPGLGEDEEELGQAPQVLGQVAQGLEDSDMFHFTSEQQPIKYEVDYYTQVTEMQRQINETSDIEDIPRILQQFNEESAVEAFLRSDEIKQSQIIYYGLVISENKEFILWLINELYNKDRNIIRRLMSTLPNKAQAEIIIIGNDPLLRMFFDVENPENIGNVLSLIPLNNIDPVIKSRILNAIGTKSFDDQKIIIEFMFDMAYRVSHDQNFYYSLGYTNVESILSNITTMLLFWCYQEIDQPPNILTIMFEIVPQYASNGFTILRDILKDLKDQNVPRYKYFIEIMLKDYWDLYLHFTSLYSLDSPKVVVDDLIYLLSELDTKIVFLKLKEYIEHLINDTRSITLSILLSRTNEEPKTLVFNSLSPLNKGKMLILLMQGIRNEREIPVEPNDTILQFLFGLIKPDELIEIIIQLLSIRKASQYPYNSNTDINRFMSYLLYSPRDHTIFEVKAQEIADVIIRNRNGPDILFGVIDQLNETNRRIFIRHITEEQYQTFLRVYQDKPLLIDLRKSQEELKRDEQDRITAYTLKEKERADRISKEKEEHSQRQQNIKDSITEYAGLKLGHVNYAIQKTDFKVDIIAFVKKLKDQNIYDEFLETYVRRMYRYSKDRVKTLEDAVKDIENLESMRQEIKREEEEKLRKDAEAKAKETNALSERLRKDAEAKATFNREYDEQETQIKRIGENIGRNLKQESYRDYLNKERHRFKGYVDSYNSDTFIDPDGYLSKILSRILNFKGYVSESDGQTLFRMNKNMALLPKDFKDYIPLFSYNTKEIIVTMSDISYFLYLSKVGFVDYNSGYGWITIINQMNALWSHYLYKYIEAFEKIDTPLEIPYNFTDKDEINHTLTEKKRISYKTIFDSLRIKTPTISDEKIIEYMFYRYELKFSEKKFMKSLD